MIGQQPGSVLELGLGNGRSFDHLRSRMPGRNIVVVERDPKPHPACVPNDTHLIIGTFEDVLPRAKDLLPDDLVLVHADIGTGDDARNARLAQFVAGQLAAFLKDGCLVASDQALLGEVYRPVPVPEGVEMGRYHLYRVTRTVGAHIMVETSTGAA